MDNPDIEKVLEKIKNFEKNELEYSVEYESGEKAKINILNDHVFKYFMSPKGVFPDNPPPVNPKDTATIIFKKVTAYDTAAFKDSYLEETEKSFVIHTKEINIKFDKINGTMSVFDNRTSKHVLCETYPLSYSKTKSTQILQQSKDEYFFGGGMQNGRFSHKGEDIDIVNSNIWVSGGVASPCPFYWSTYGYGVLRHTWQKGSYDFRYNFSESIKTSHDCEDFDAFYFINSNPIAILADYFELTGTPIFMPEFAFYEGHLDCFNRDYWVEVNPETRNARLFEDGKYYKCYKPKDVPKDKKAILESLNGEKHNYQFSARAMVDRYKKHDVPLGWFIPNDGYGSGYGQTNSLDGDIENLKEFADYARMNGVEVALWTESNLEPKDPDHPKKGERDLAKEVGKAGVVALKCDVAWVGDGYSFALNAVDHATKMFKNSTQRRPLILMVDGWGGTQRYSGIWSGDQTGGYWEYIRFHIPTYIGTGLSGQPIVGSDMDGIYGGGNKEINIRDYQWKAFTPLQLNMDGWGDNMKSPFAFDEEATSINRAYLKLKSMMMPYNYSIGHESTLGLPMVRAMFLEFPDETPAYTLDSQYQFMWGPSFLVAPIYQAKGSIDGSIRDGIFLPDPNQVWIDLFTGEKYQGGKIYNNIKAPLWKIPVFVRDGAIVPMVNPSNNPNEIKRDNRIFHIYPNGDTKFNVYEDDGISADYLNGESASTKIKVSGPKSNETGDLVIVIHATNGNYRGIVKERATLLRIMASEDIDHIKAHVNNGPLELIKAESEEDFDEQENAFFFKKDFVINPYLAGITGANLNQKFLLIKINKMDVTENLIHLQINGYRNNDKIFGSNNKLSSYLKKPKNFTSLAMRATVLLNWEQVNEATYYEIERNGVIFTNIVGNVCTFDGKPGNEYSFRIRSVNNGVSEWSNFVYVTNIEDPYKNTVKGVKATCTASCEYGQEICKLTDGKYKSIWHTNWNMPNIADSKTRCSFDVKFDLGDVYELEKMEYVPRDDAGNGTILKMQYRHSVDGKDWSEYSDTLQWAHDAENKEVTLNGAKMRFVEWKVLDSVGGFGSGRQVLFYKKN